MAKDPSKYAHKTCPVCGAGFEHLITSKSAGIYCSNKCRFIGQKKHRDEIKCAHCGKIVLAPYKKSWRDSKKWCSWECYSADRKAQTEYIEKKCQECGKVFIVKKSIEHRYKVCGKQCRLAHNQAAIGNCEVCGKTFKYRKDSQIGRFCSVACYRRSRGETSLERIVRDAIENTNYEFGQEVKFGRYAVDFYLPSVGIAIEADGDYWHAKTKERDQRKDKYLSEKGICVIRISENFAKSHKNLSDYLRTEIVRIIKSSDQDIFLR